MWARNGIWSGQHDRRGGQRYEFLIFYRGGSLTNAGSLTVANYRGFQLAVGSSLTNLSTGVIARDSTGNAGFSPAIIGLSGGAATVGTLGRS